MKSPQVSILLLTLNPGPGLPGLLNMLFDQQDAPRFEVVVVDSSSDDGSAQAAQVWPLRWHTIRRTEFSHGRTRNLAASLAQGELLVYLSQDALPADQSWLARLLAPFQETAVAGVYGRQLPYPDTPWTQRYFLAQTYPAQGRRLHLQGDGPITLRRIFFSNVNSCIRKRVWQQHPFDETVIMSEDQAWARATLRAGYDLVYAPDAAVYHAHTYSLSSALRRNFDSGYSLRGIVQDSLAMTVSSGLGYVADEVVWVRRCAGWQAVPYVLVFELARLLGFSLGRHAERLPLSWRLRLSQQPGWWLHKKGAP